MVEFQVLVSIIFIVASTMVWIGNSANIRIPNNNVSLEAAIPLNSTSSNSEDEYRSTTEVNLPSPNESNDPGFIVSEDSGDQLPPDTDFLNIDKLSYLGFTVSESSDDFNITDILPEQNPQNITCVKMDYDQDVAAVFKGEAGPIETASLVFNTTYTNFRDGIIYNISNITDLDGFNETIVDCELYFGGATVYRKLSSLAMYSLAG